MENYKHNDSLRIIYPKMGDSCTLWVAAECIISSYSMHFALFYCTLHCQQHTLQFMYEDMINRRGNVEQLCNTYTSSAILQAWWHFTCRECMNGNLLLPTTWVFMQKKNLTSWPSFNKMWCFSKMFMKVLSIKFQEMCPVGAAMIHAEGETDRHEEANRHLLQLCELA